MYAFDSMEMELYEQEIKNKKMAYQNLFNTVADITGHQLLESEISEIVHALETDINDHKSTTVVEYECNHDWINNSGFYFCRHCNKPKHDYRLLI